MSAVLELPWNFSDELPFQGLGYYWKGEIKFHSGASLSVVAAHASKMGMVPASIIATRMALHFRPKLLIMSGICAGFPGTSSIGDAILANPTWDWQAGKKILKDNMPDFSSEPHQLDVDEVVVSKFQVMCEDREIWQSIRADWKGTAPPRDPKGVIGACASGSSVLADTITASNIKYQQHRKLTAIDMEIYGIYSVGHYLPSPRPYTFAIKGFRILLMPKRQTTFRHMRRTVALEQSRT
ncbi:MAG: 5'-methylthioadenosine/S-adenosylhomocysteine nucleosidase [Pleurocapsa sp. SU_196_0]|nr:5'-methylthioadenosine/S-adenosylhomocysteine nucleosidase [Pleurocapsa sp. SU_196_0]